MLKCNATIEEANDGAFTVKVWSPELPGITSTYTVKAIADHYAVQEAIERFIHERSKPTG
jgi:hypothetical protein